MGKLQSQGVHHITLTGANTQTSIDFWEGVLGMPLVFEQPNLGLLIELANYKFEPPLGCSHADVLMEAHKQRVTRNDYAIAEVHVADAIEKLSSTRERLSGQPHG